MILRNSLKTKAKEKHDELETSVTNHFFFIYSLIIIIGLAVVSLLTYIWAFTVFHNHAISLFITGLALSTFSAFVFFVSREIWGDE